MNKQKTVPALMGVLCLGLLLSACATFETNAYKVIGTTTTTVEAARKAWVAYVTQQRVVVASNPVDAGKLEVEVAKVGAAYAQYQTAMRAAHDAVVALKSTNGTQDGVTLAFTALSAASGNLVALINSIISPTPTVPLAK